MGKIRDLFCKKNEFKHQEHKQSIVVDDKEIIQDMLTNRYTSKVDIQETLRKNVTDKLVTLFMTNRTPDYLFEQLAVLSPKEQRECVRIAKQKQKEYSTLFEAAKNDFDPVELRIIAEKKYNILLVIPHASQEHFRFWMNNIRKDFVSPPSANIYKMEPSELPIDDARNKAITAGILRGITHFMFLDDDVQPKETDYMIRLFEDMQEYSVVCGVYNKRTSGSPVSACMTRDSVGNLCYLPENSSGLVNAAVVNAGLLMIEASVFDKIEPPFFKTGYAQDGKKVIDDDAYFSKKCEEAGIEMAIDSSIKADHFDRITGVRY